MYRYRYGEWPQRLEITSRTLWSLAVQFGRENLGRLAERLEIRTIPESPDGVYPAESLTVSGEAAASASPTPGATSSRTETRAWPIAHSSTKLQAGLASTRSRPPGAEWSNPEASQVPASGRSDLSGSKP